MFGSGLGLAWMGLVESDWRAIRSAALLYTNYVAPEEVGWTVGHFWFGRRFLLGESRGAPASLVAG